MALLLKAIGGVTGVILLVATLLGSLVAVGGFLLSAIKVLIIVIFLAVVTIIGFSIIRDRTRRRRESADL